MINDVDIPEEAQKKLSKFSCLLHNLETMEMRVAALKKKLNTLTDAKEEAEISLADDDLWFRVGECYFLREAASVEEALEENKKEIKEEMKKTEEEIKIKSEEAEKLKKELYAQLGDKVRLER